jgi:carbon storage regulator
LAFREILILIGAAVANNDMTAHQLLKEGNVMLVLTRQVGQEIVIDGNIRVTITAVKGDKVRIGITAPPEVRIDREEVHRRLQEFAAPTMAAAR